MAAVNNGNKRAANKLFGVVAVNIAAPMYGGEITMR